MGQDVECQYLCDRVVGRNDMQWAQQLIEGGYVTEWILDNLPGATSFVTPDRARKYYAAGFKMGYKALDMASGRERYYLNNHYTLVVRWRAAPGRAGNNGGKVIVGFEVYAKSIYGSHRNETGCPLDVSGDNEPLALYMPSMTGGLKEQYADSSYIPEEVIDMDDGVTMTIPYTYSVYFRETNDVEWANRWDLYFNDQAESAFTHWLAIINSLIISGILGAVCIVILGRTMQGDVKGRGDGVLEEARLRIVKRVERRNLELVFSKRLPRLDRTTICLPMRNRWRISADGSYCTGMFSDHHHTVDCLLLLSARACSSFSWSQGS